MRSQVRIRSAVGSKDAFGALLTLLLLPPSLPKDLRLVGGMMPVVNWQSQSQAKTCEELNISWYGLDWPSSALTAANWIYDEYFFQEQRQDLERCETSSSTQSTHFFAVGPSKCCKNAPQLSLSGNVAKLSGHKRSDQTCEARAVSCLSRGFCELPGNNKMNLMSEITFIIRHKSQEKSLDQTLKHCPLPVKSIWEKFTLNDLLELVCDHCRSFSSVRASWRAHEKKNRQWPHTKSKSQPSIVTQKEEGRETE